MLSGSSPPRVHFNDARARRRGAQARCPGPDPAPRGTKGTYEGARALRCGARRGAYSQFMDATPAQRVRTTLELFDLAEAMVRQRVRREHPELSIAQVDAHVLRWLRHRPGAEHGDAEGSVRSRP